MALAALQGLPTCHRAPWDELPEGCGVRLRIAARDFDEHRRAQPELGIVRVHFEEDGAGVRRFGQCRDRIPQRVVAATCEQHL